MFSTEVTVSFQQADPAGIMFFANIFYLTHFAKEKLVTEGFQILYEDWFNSKEHGAPIRHCESQYFKPLRPGQTYKVEITAKHVGHSSYTLIYRFVRNEVIHAEATVTNVFISVKDKKKIEIPADIKAKIAKLLPNA